MDKREFTKIMAGLCELYNKEVSEFILDIYWRIFGKYDLKTFQRGIDGCLVERKYNTVPKPAEILEFIEGKQEDMAALAWSQVVKAVREYDYINTVIFKDKTIHQVIDHLGGWQWLCDQTKDELKFIAKDFYRLYPVFKKRGGDTPKLTGFVEQENQKMGYEKDIPAPVKVDEEKKDQKQIHRTRGRAGG